MNCSKIGGPCPHPIGKDNNYIFVMMPFKEMDSVYDAIKQAVENIDGKKFNCERADSGYTNISIWCERICQPIRKSKYCIVDTTGKNPNVFYEFGFAHATLNTKTIIITQCIADAPFDVRDIGHIEYTEKNLPELREKLKKAIWDLEKKEAIPSLYKSPDELIYQLKKELREEEERSGKFKNQLKESEERETKLKEHILEIEAIQKNPSEEAINTITELEKSIAGYKSKLKFIEISKTEEIEQLKKTLSLKEQELIKLEKELNDFRISNNDEDLSNALFQEVNRKAEAEIWFRKAYKETDLFLKCEYYSKAVEINSEYGKAYSHWGWALTEISKSKSGKEKEQILLESINKFQISIQTYPNNDSTYYNWGWALIEIAMLKSGEEKEQILLESINKFQTSIQINPNDEAAFNNWGLALIEISLLKSGKEREQILLESINKFRNCIQIYPKSSAAYNNWSWALSEIICLKPINEKIQFLNEIIELYEKAIELNADNIVTLENISEIYIITKIYQKAEKVLTIALSKAVEIKDIAILTYLEIILKKLLNINTDELDNQLNNYLKEDFKLMWSFSLIEDWLKYADITKENIKYIQNLTEKIKQKTK